MATLADVQQAIRTLETGVLTELRGLSTVLQATVGRGTGSGGRQPESEQFTDAEQQRFNLSALSNLIPTSTQASLRQVASLLPQMQNWGRLLSSLMGGEQRQSGPTSRAASNGTGQPAIAGGPVSLSNAASIVVNTTAAVVVNAAAQASAGQRAATGASQSAGHSGTAAPAPGTPARKQLDEVQQLQQKLDWLGKQHQAAKAGGRHDEVQDLVNHMARARAALNHAQAGLASPQSVAAAGTTAARTTPASVAVNAAGQAVTSRAASNAATGAGSAAAGAAARGAGAAAAGAGAGAAGGLGAAGAALGGPLGIALFAAMEAKKKLQQVHDDPVGTLKDGVKALTGPVGQLAFKLMDAAKHVEGHSRAVLENQRALAEVSAGMAAVMAQSDMRKIMRDREVGDRSSASAGKLASSLHDLSDSMKESRILAANVQNLVAAGFNKALTPAVKLLDSIAGAVNKILEKMGISNTDDLDTMQSWVERAAKHASEARKNDSVLFRPVNLL